MNDDIKKKELFNKGLKFYKDGNYFEAHEYWEDLWSDYYIEDKRFIQGLIQLAVSFVHLSNGNMNGAKSLLKKSEEKFQAFSGIHRDININFLLYQIKKVGEFYDKMVDPKLFDWTLVPTLR